ncbi:helicase HerA-like domain-containing protein [Hyphomonas sp.]|uniref:helicase HerA-like domain-containing protein n=1 Tax=Hyphomonas sp. TaxID=87 RepID=UPI00391C9230
MTETIFLGGADANGTGHPDAAQSLILKVANRHGLVAGATGTGKTVTLQIMAQAFSDAGVPVFAADVKGDLSGICMPGSETHKAHAALTARAQQIGMGELKYQGAPTIFWDVFGESGHPIRATISEMGPLLLSRLMGLTDVQEGVLNIAFQYADDNGLLLLDLKDLRKLLVSLGDDTVRTEVSRKYGNVAPASLSAVQRELLVLERGGAERFFGEPALELADFMRTTTDGRGYVNILDARKLINSPKLYSTFLLWLLSELFEELPEIGDPEKPRLVFFFDEAHLLFADSPPALMQKIEQVVRLIRSKGVGVYFVTQNPRDLPESVLAQLGNRMQHALRAYTPTEQKAVKSAAASFRPNPAFKTEAAITEMGVGEALVSTLEAKGAPNMVQKTMIRPPSSRLGPATDPERAEIQKTSPVFGKYDKTVDRESAYEILSKREETAAKEAEKLAKLEAKEKEAAAKAKAKGKTATTRSRRMSTTERAVNNAASTASREVVRYVLRGIFGTRKR